MALRLVKVDRETPTRRAEVPTPLWKAGRRRMLLPPDLCDWVPENHIVHFLLDAASEMPKNRFSFNWRGTGSEPYPPEMLLSLLIYSYCTGRFSSRVIEEATHSDVIIRYICGGDHHPDHDTICCAFRRKNIALFEEAFLHVLLMAQATGGLKKVGTVSVDCTKIKANASKHSAVSYKRAGERLSNWSVGNIRLRRTPMRQRPRRCDIGYEQKRGNGMVFGLPCLQYETDVQHALEKRPHCASGHGDGLTEPYKRCASSPRRRNLHPKQRHSSQPPSDDGETNHMDKGNLFREAEF